MLKQIMSLSQMHFCRKFLGSLFSGNAVYKGTQKETKNKLTTKFPSQSRICISFITKIIKICFLLLVLSGWDQKDFYNKNYNIKLQIINAASKKTPETNKIKEFLVAVATNEEQQERGLMFVKNLPKNYGMLFDFKEEKVVNMWMKNTKITLDIIFIDKNHKIVAIKHKAQPESLDIINCKFLITMVLEINGGLADELGIKLGDEIKIQSPVLLDN